MAEKTAPVMHAPVSRMTIEERRLRVAIADAWYAGRRSTHTLPIPSGTGHALTVACRAYVESEVERVSGVSAETPQATPDHAALLAELREIAMNVRAGYEMGGLTPEGCRSTAEALDDLVAALTSPVTVEPQIACPACGETVKQVASATLSLALWQHYNWVCAGRSSANESDGAVLIMSERSRHITVEGWAPEHDDAHENAELVCAAICYAEVGSGFNLEISPSRTQPVPFLWPWEAAWWKPSDDQIRNLVKAGALIAAEIDRLKRLSTIAPPEATAPTGDDPR